MTVLEDLLARVEKATGPDDQIDCVIYRTFNDLGNRPSYTSSIDAAVTLVERVIPGAALRIEGTYSTSLADHKKLTWRCQITEAIMPDELDDSYPTAPIAILAAMLKAKIAEETIRREN